MTIMAFWKYFVVGKPYGTSPAAKCSLPENKNQVSCVKITQQRLSRRTVSEDIPGRKTAIRSEQQSREFFCSAIDESLKRCEKSRPGFQYCTRARMLSIFSSLGNGLQDVNFNSLPPRSRSGSPAASVHIAYRPQHRPDHLSWLSGTWTWVKLAFFPDAYFW